MAMTRRWLPILLFAGAFGPSCTVLFPFQDAEESDGDADADADGDADADCHPGLLCGGGECVASTECDPNDTPCTANLICSIDGTEREIGAAADTDGQSDWYRVFEYGDDGLYVVTSGFEDDAVDTIVAVFDAPPDTSPDSDEVCSLGCDALSALGCNDDCNDGGEICSLEAFPPFSELWVSAPEGTELWIRVVTCPPGTGGLYWIYVD